MCEKDINPIDAVAFINKDYFFKFKNTKNIEFNIKNG